MIGRLRGLIIEKKPPEIVIEVNGIGYEVAMPMTCFYELPEYGEEVIIFTHLIVREDAQLLYGFNREQERSLFRELIKVNGVGPKLALTILSGMSASQFILAMQQSEIKSLVKLPGVGKKTAERLIVEMKDRLKQFTSSSISNIIPSNFPADPISQDNEAKAEAISALIALGYKSQEASKIINKVVRTGIDSQTLIKEALKAAL